MGSAPSCGLLSIIADLAVESNALWKFLGTVIAFFHNKHAFLAGIARYIE